MKRFIAVNFLMRIKQLPSYEDCWSSDPMIQNQYISNTTSLKRFQWFLLNFHLNDNSKMPSREDNSYDKLYKVRPFFKNLNKQFLNCFEPSEVQANDESMIKFKGRCSFKQYIPLKPIKRSYKVWVSADENGYVYQFKIYTGKGKIKGMGLGESVVEKLCKPISNKSYKLLLTIVFQVCI